jgi:hypothetical protein
MVKDGESFTEHGKRCEFKYFSRTAVAFTELECGLGGVHGSQLKMQHINPLKLYA